MRALALTTLLLLACAQEPAPPAPPPAPPAEVTPPPPQPQAIALTGGRVDLVSVKNGSAEVPARFEVVQGQVSIDPLAIQATTGTLTIDLASWNSDLELRDTRMKEVFFGVAEHPTTTFELAAIDAPSGKLEKVGDKVTGTARGALTWRAVRQELSLPVELTRTADQAYAVHVPRFEQSIAALQMNEPLQALIKVCEHESVDDVVKVSLDLQVGVQPPPPAEPPPPAAEGERVLEQPARPLGDAPTPRPIERAQPESGRALPKSGQ